MMPPPADEQQPPLHGSQFYFPAFVSSADLRRMAELRPAAEQQRTKQPPRRGASRT